MNEKIKYAVKRGKGITIETDLSPYRKILNQIKSINHSECSDSELKGLSCDLREKACKNGDLDTLLPEAFALVREAAKRALGEDPFDVQIIAGIAMHQGKLAQMQTGEGKTLAAVFPAYLNSLTGKGVHVFTANEYLAQRDSQWMGKVYSFLNCTVSSIRETSSSLEKRDAYQADITYLTAKQGGFDFLQDHLQYDPGGILQRPFAFAIVDEADFILIDEARVPLVIASRTEEQQTDPAAVDSAVRKLVPGIDYTVDRHKRNSYLTIEGEKKVRILLKCGGIHDEKSFPVYAAVNVALHAHNLLARDVDYIIKNGKIELVDEFTGRIADNRKWPYGIQTALEAKEGLALQPSGRISGSITVQHFVSQYPKIAAMTATAVSAAEEFINFYGLATVIIPPNKPSRMVHLPDRVYPAKKQKLDALIEEISHHHSAGRPLLVGTRSVKESQELFELLKSKGISCEVLNAKNDAKEAELVAKAGMLGAVTISTNMAGRGTDIRLGGEGEIRRDEILALGGLYVIGTNRHESVRIDNQLRGRAGRQGDPGMSRFFVSLEDDLIQRYGIIEFIPKIYLSSFYAKSIEDRHVAKEISRAQTIIEDQHYEMRRTLRKYSALTEKQRAAVQAVRRDALIAGRFPGSLMEDTREQRAALRKVMKEEKILLILQRIFLSRLDAFWAGHLEFIDDVKEGIHLQRYGGKDPILVFIHKVSDAFSLRMEKAETETAELFNKIEPSKEASEDVLSRHKGPASTWTYLINDNPFPNFSLAVIAGANIGFAALASFQALLLIPLAGIFTGIKKLMKKRNT